MYHQSIGKKQLYQFTVSADVYFNLTENGSMLKSVFALHRNPSYLVINNYLPSFCMMLMTIIPLFLNEEIHFATAIMLVLTSMLCLYTIFQSSISDVPKTAYLKVIGPFQLIKNILSFSFFKIFLLVLRYVTLSSNKKVETLNEMLTYIYIKKQIETWKLCSKYSNFF